MTRFAIRFLLGAAVGAFAAFFVGLISESAGRRFGLTTALLAVLFGALAQLPVRRLTDPAERALAWAGWALLLATIAAVVGAAVELRLERDRCLRCCQPPAFRR